MINKLGGKDAESVKENNFLLGKNVVVTGSTGYLGSTFLKILQKEPCSLTLLCRNSDAVCLESLGNVKVIVGDMSDRAIWKDLLNNADYVFHLAGLEYNRKNFNHDLDLQLNFLSVVNLLQACDKFGFSPKIIFTSSSNIAKNKLDGQVSELDQDDPMSIWSLHKLISENYLNYYSKNYGIKIVSLRFSNIYGPPDNLKTFSRSSINKMILNGIVKREINLYSNSESTRDFLYVEDAAKALLLAAKFIDKLQEKPYYYVGSDIGYSYYDSYVIIKNAIFNILGIDVLEKIKTDQMSPFDMRSFVTDSSNFRSTTGFQAETSFQFGIIKTILSSLELKGLL